VSVSKRIRYEILRRDQNACQYCGSMAPDVALTIDHVVPVALGGSDDPTNLAAACRDCNAGKTSIPADAPIVERVSLAAASFKLALHDRLAELGDGIAAELDAVDHFEAIWAKHVSQWKREAWPLPDDYADTVMRWHRMGVTNDTFEYAIRIAMSKKDVVGSSKFLYTAGIIWTLIRKAEEEAQPSTAPVDAQARAAAWQDGLETGQRKLGKFIERHLADILLTFVVDGGRFPEWALTARRVA
jgi:hypothetical protein